MNLSGIDLNLLVLLDVMLQERSVTRAGRRLGLSQPATSHALARLRETLDDPLFVREGRVMVPTPRARELAEPVSDWLREAESLLRSDVAFEPERTRGVVTVAASDYSSMLLFGPLMSEVATRAPRLRLRWRTYDGALIRDQLVAGAVDIGLALGRPDNLPNGLLHEGLFEDDFVCLVRKDHPRIDGPVDLDTYCSVPHVLISPRGDAHGVVDDALAAMGRSRTVGIVVPSFELAPRAVAACDGLLNLNRRYASLVLDSHELQVLEPPLRLPTGTLSMVWHPRTDTSPLHAWMRDRIADAAATVSEPRTPR